MILANVILSRLRTSNATKLFISSQPQMLHQNVKTEERMNFNLPGEDHDSRNHRLKRPLSPHLGVYKFSNNMIMSISHRITGLALCGIPIGLASVAVFLPESFPFYMESLQAMDLNTWIITVGKFCVAFPFSYHFLNGIRHLVWDVGYLWTPKQVDVSGYVLVLCAIALAVHLVLY